MLPEPMFSYLPSLKYLDLRMNFLVSLPNSLAFHVNLEIVLLAGNLFQKLPLLLITLPNLRRVDLKLLEVETSDEYQNCMVYVKGVSFFNLIFYLLD